jgi:hypothetical protein
MGNREYYEKKLEIISTIKDSQIKKPHHIPVAFYIQEADKKKVPGEIYINIIWKIMGGCHDAVCRGPRPGPMKKNV